MFADFCTLSGVEFLFNFPLRNFRKACQVCLNRLKVRPLQTSFVKIIESAVARPASIDNIPGPEDKSPKNAVKMTRDVEGFAVARPYALFIRQSH